jgi:DNA-binding NtrC family response regulator
MKEETRHSRVGPLRGVRVLVVENDFILLMDLEAVLSEADAEIAGRSRIVSHALDAVERERFSVAVMDVRVGPETIVPVARRLAQRGIPFLFYTGQVGVDGTLAEWPKSKIIAKPAKAQIVVDAVAELLA